MITIKRRLRITAKGGKRRRTDPVSLANFPSPSPLEEYEMHVAVTISRKQRRRYCAQSGDIEDFQPAKLHRVTLAANCASVFARSIHRDDLSHVT